MNTKNICTHFICPKFFGYFLFYLLLIFNSNFLSGQVNLENLPSAYIVPNFHPASCGWLTNWSLERNYCANSYMDHLDRVTNDPNYKFVLSECNNLIAIENFRPERFKEIKERIKEKRIELPNAFFLESTINLSGGEALVKMGVEGLRWQKHIMGVKPRFCWAIDVCGTHEQMPQICTGLGLEGLIYVRCNPSDKQVFWSKSPDGSKIKTFVPDHYSDFRHLFRATGPLSDSQYEELYNNLKEKAIRTPEGAPILVLAGSQDYSLAPFNPKNPTEFLDKWKTIYPNSRIQIATFSDYFDFVKSMVNSELVKLPVIEGGTTYTYDSFWIQNPKVKTWYRQNEHTLQATEILSTISSLQSGFNYPVQSLYHAWLLMLLNMDRNTLWGAAGGMVFEHKTSWDVSDRFKWVEDKSLQISEEAIRKYSGNGNAVTLFNALNWDRTDPVYFKHEKGIQLSGEIGEHSADGLSVYQIQMPSIGFKTLKLKNGKTTEPKTITFPETIETKYYSVKIDSVTGGISSLKLKPSGRELLSGTANVLAAERRTSQRGELGDHMDPRPQRLKLATSNDFKPLITVKEGPLSYIVKVESEFYGGSPVVRLMRFYKNFQRIDFVTELNDVPDSTVVVAEFPLIEVPLEIRRGIPFGFSHAAWSKSNENLHDHPEGIKPIVRWIDYTFQDGSGLAILDRGLSGREINENIPIIYLFNSIDKYYGYPNPWLSGKGKHLLEYALVPHKEEWDIARIPQRAWEYNSPVIVTNKTASKSTVSFVQTSDNVIVEAIRREGNEIEVRLVECLGKGGNTTVKVKIPHISAALTNFLGNHSQPVTGKGKYTFEIKPQQIITLRLKTESTVKEIEPLISWDELVPPVKRAALKNYQVDKKGHPPRGE